MEANTTQPESAGPNSGPGSGPGSDPTTPGEAKAASAVATILVIALLGGGVALGIYLFGSTTAARISMTPTPQSASFVLEEASTAQVWADIEVTHSDFSPNIAAVELPHVIDYVIEIERAGADAISLRCNPFDAYVMKRSDGYNSIGEDAGRWYDGRVEGCSVALEAGSYTLRAHTEPVQPDARVRFGKNDLVLRVD